MKHRLKGWISNYNHPHEQRILSLGQLSQTSELTVSRDYNLRSRSESRLRPLGHVIYNTPTPKTILSRIAAVCKTQCIDNPAAKQKKGKHWQPKWLNVEDRRKMSYLDSGNYSTSLIERQLFHLLLLLILPLLSIICSPDNKKHRRENPKQTAENRCLSVCVSAQRHVCVRTEEGGHTAGKRRECTVYVNHWGDDIQSEWWWQPLCLNGNTSFSVSPALCCSLALGQFVASWFKKKEKRRRQDDEKMKENKSCSSILKKTKYRIKTDKNERETDENCD